MGQKNVLVSMPRSFKRLASWSRLAPKSGRVRTLSATTGQVANAIAAPPGGSRTHTFDRSHQADSIDEYILADLKQNNITPAALSTDWEFIRRVTLDLTGLKGEADYALPSRPAVNSGPACRTVQVRIELRRQPILPPRERR